MSMILRKTISSQAIYKHIRLTETETTISNGESDCYAYEGIALVVLALLQPVRWLVYELISPAGAGLL